MLYPLVKSEDKDSMREYYIQACSRPVANKLISDIEWRIYTEWCCNRGESRPEQHQYYNGHAFAEWIQKEAHYAMVRRGFRWDDPYSRFRGKGDVAQAYSDIRRQVMHAVVEKALDFFGDPNIHKPNLRGSLEPYLAKLG